MSVRDFVAVAPCGCVRWWRSGNYPLDAEAKRAVAECVTSGYEIRRVTTEEARAMPYNCETVHPSKQPAPKVAEPTQLSFRGRS